jgi:hypothetical protein
MRLPYIVLGTLLLAGCSTHVDLTPLPPRMTPEQRVQAFAKLRVAERGTETVVACAGRRCGASPRPVLILADGTEVRQAEDLLVVVPPDSATARSARRVTELKSRSGWVKAGGLAGFLTGLAIAYKGVSTDEPNFTIMGIGVGVALATGITAGVMSTLMARDAQRYTRQAFRTYEDDLVQHLALCARGLALVPCEAPALPEDRLAPPGAAAPVGPSQTPVR